MPCPNPLNDLIPLWAGRNDTQRNQRKADHRERESDRADQKYFEALRQCDDGSSELIGRAID